MVKEKIKEGLSYYFDKKYEMALAQRKTEYDAFIKEKEQTLPSFDMSIDKEAEGDDVSEASLSLGASYEGTTLRIMPYSLVDASFNIKNYIDDIIVFTNGVLSEKAIPLIANTFKNSPAVNVIYGDEDRIEFAGLNELEYSTFQNGKRVDPYFKPDWSPNAFLDHFYFCNIVAIRRSAFREEMRVKETAGAACVYENLLRYLFKNEHNLRKTVEHIDEVLIHVSDYDLNELSISNSYRYISKDLTRSGEVKISVVIPSKDNPDLLKKCLESLKETQKESIETEVVVIDNGSLPENRASIQSLSKELGFTYIYEACEFNFAAMINKAAENTKHDYLLILNDDITFVCENTLSKMAAMAQLNFTGAVGLKLLYPDSKMIQHAGVFNDRIGPVHKLQFLSDEEGHYHNFNKHIQNVSAVTGACLLIRKDIFKKAGRMNESLRVAFNDIDLSFKVMEMGYVNVVLNNIFAYHAESVTRGKDTDTKSLDRLSKEKDVLYNLHSKLINYDPFGSKYLKKDCLDVSLSVANEYEYEKAIETDIKVKAIKTLDGRDEPCVQLAVEYAGPMDKYSYVKEDSDKVYIQGFSYLLGSDNAFYKKSIILKNESDIFKIPIKGALREDILRACPKEYNAGLSGFSLSIDRKNLKASKYQVGILYEKAFSKEKLYSFSNRVMVVK